MQLTPFHIAVQIRDIDEARDFYGVKMGLSEGRSMGTWIDFKAMLWISNGIIALSFFLYHSTFLTPQERYTPSLLVSALYFTPSSEP